MSACEVSWASVNSTRSAVWLRSTNERSVPKMYAPRMLFHLGGFFPTNSLGRSLMSMRSRMPAYARSGSSGVGNVPATPVAARASSTIAGIFRRARGSTMVMPSLPPSSARLLPFSGEFGHEVEGAVLLVGVELVEGAQRGDEVLPLRRCAARLPVAGELHQLGVLELVDARVVPEDVRCRLLDGAALDLRRVRVRDAGHLLDLP